MRLRSDNLTWRELDGETVVLDLASSKYLTVNGSGTVLLKLLTEDRDREALVQALVAEYGIGADQAGNDVDAFVGVLTSKGLLA